MVETRPNRTMGPAHDEFWAYCNESEFRLQHCHHCTRFFWPPVPACDTCGEWILRWQQVSGRGKIVSYCVFEHLYYQECQPPWDTIVVELEEGPLFLSNPEGFTTDEIVPDMPVTVSFIDCKDGTGEFRLPVFRRA